MEFFSPPGKGLPVDYIGMLKRETNWAELDVRQRIGQIGRFLAHNREERATLRRMGAIRLKLEEAKE
eukprot:10131572-Heterocapsa_arctica.AAC.1